MTGLDLMVDIDEVIFPMMSTIHDRAQQEGLHDGTAEMAWAGWVHYRLPTGEPCPEDVYWKLWSDFAREGGYVSTPPIPGSVEALRHLHFEGHRIHLVTARGFMANANKIRRWTPEWVEEFAVPHTTLTFARDKVAAQAELGVRFDLALDDSPKNYQALADDGVNVWLQRHPHNREFEASTPDVCAVDTAWEWTKIAERIPARG